MCGKVYVHSSAHVSDIVRVCWLVGILAWVLFAVAGLPHHGMPRTTVSLYTG